MKVEFRYDDLLRMSEMECFAEDYDAFLKVSRLLVEFVPNGAIRTDLLAVAAACAFRRGIEGSLDPGGKIDRPVAEAITLFLEQNLIDFPEINFRPKEPKRMPNVFAIEVVGETDSPVVSNSAFQDRELCLRLSNSSKVAGSSMELPNVNIPTNAWVLASAYPKYSIEWWGPFIATAIILTDTFEVGTIKISQVLDRGDEHLLRQLLRTIDMRLIVES